MSTSRARSAAGLLALLAMVQGCADEDPERLKVRGAAQVELDATRSGFEFAEDTLLEDDRVGRYERLAGHCTVSPGAEGEPEILSVGLARPAGAPAEGEGLVSLVLRFEGATVAEAKATLGETDFVGTPGPACALELLYLRSGDGVAGVEAACTLAADDGRTAELSAELHFAGCATL